MDATEHALNLFSTRIRQMLLQYKELKKENAELYAMVDEREEQIKTLNAKLVQAQNGDLESAQKRLQRLIRDVNKCITLLSEK